MEVKEIIKKIEDEMLCANACPMYHKAHYEIEKCSCYKKEIIETLKTRVLIYRHHAIDMLNAMKLIQKYYLNKGKIEIHDPGNVNECIIAAIESTLDIQAKLKP